MEGKENGKKRKIMGKGKKNGKERKIKSKLER